MAKELAGKCDAFCHLQGREGTRGVFIEIIEKDGVKKGIYSCGLGNKECIIPYLAQRINETAQMSYEALRGSRTRICFLSKQSF